MALIDWPHEEQTQKLAYNLIMIVSTVGTAFFISGNPLTWIPFIIAVAWSANIYYDMYLAPRFHPEQEISQEDAVEVGFSEFLNNQGAKNEKRIASLQNSFGLAVARVEELERKIAAAEREAQKEAESEA